MVIWITGLSGAGKSTIAREVVTQLKREGGTPLLLDGDAVRDAIADPSTRHDRASRLANAYRICRLARMAEEQGLTVVVATMSLFHEIHDWNRANFSRYLEVFVKADLAELRRRDSKKLYSRQAAGAEANVGGVDIAVEEPRAPHLVLDNTATLTSFEAPAGRILSAARGVGAAAG